MSTSIRIFLGLSTLAASLLVAADEPFEVTPPPARLEADPFYQKHISAGGLPILSSAKVSDEGLREAARIVTHMLQKRPEVRRALIEADVRIVVMHQSESTTDVPEQRHMKPKKFWDLRARGLGGRITSCGEENLLNLPGDRYATENILVHEFAHCMQGGVAKVDPTFPRRLKAAYEHAKATGLWKSTYAATSSGEYWAEGVQSWFDTNRQNDSLHNHVDTREELEAYDPALAALIAEVYGHPKWRYERYDVRTRKRAARFRFSRFYAEREYGGNGKPGFVRSGDMDGDGDLDLVAGGGRALYLYRVSGRVAEWERSANLDGTGSIGAGGAVLLDVDRDGDADVVSAKCRGDLGWWENPGFPFGDGPWTFHRIAESHRFLHDLIPADADGDGEPDRLYATLLGRSGGAQRITVLELEPPSAAEDPTAPGGWSTRVVDADRPEENGEGHAGLDTGDVDRDGHLDLAFAGGWYEAPGDPSGRWTWHPVASVRGISNVKLRDLDRDGRLDLVVAAGHGGTGLFWFAGPADPAGGKWMRHEIDASIPNPEGLEVLDIDRDGDLDAVTCQLDPERWDREVHHAWVIENAGTASSPSWRRHDASGAAFACHQLRVVDLDGDGQLDIAAEGCGHGVISFYQNTTPPRPAARRPSIVVIVSDDQGYADVSSSPHHRPEVSTPWLDALARESVSFSRAYTSGNVCSPTRAGLMTGRYQQRAGIYTAGEGGSGLPLGEKIFPQFLRPLGYSSGAFGKWHLGLTAEYSPVRRGFDEFYGFLGRGAHDYFALSDAASPMYRGLEPVSDEGYLTTRLTDEAVSFIRRHREKPFFLYLAYNAVHAPPEAPEEDVKKFHTGDPARDVLMAMLLHLDAGVGRVVDTLKKEGLFEDTLLFYLTDNGGSKAMHASNSPLRGFKHENYEGGVRTPFFVSWPRRFPGGRVIDVPVISLDILPTALAAAGRPPPRESPLDGANLLPLLEGQSAAPPARTLFWSEGGWSGEWAVRAGKWKLVARREARELFDLEADPSEATDLAAREPAVLEELTGRYERWLEAMAEPRSGAGKKWSAESEARAAAREKKRAQRRREREKGRARRAGKPRDGKATRS